MDSPQKLSNTKEVIAFLAETFPACFSTQGEAKPLKIGIFQDLAERLKDDERVSKTQLRSTLRHYTNSWRYLHSVKVGAERVGLDGEADSVVEQEHADHAQQQLQESKQRVAERRKQQAQKKPNRGEKGEASSQKKAKPTQRTGTKAPRKQPNRQGPPPKLEEGDLKAGTKVSVKLAKAPVKGVITEVVKDGVQVQLDSGMSVKVPVDTLRLARQ
ncbi:RNA chaperone ProQ [Saliniradius amylolyticus]|uniref:RNA chaperone ProQ n=1 Tax=Saliniradius amylolyticus TaxID=2183582 RepID=A0A2S2E2K2_9ALTE|nr:RNA chaperone ProQ [Saliniradius amylolyticus]AWL11886.1 RNA chaperone ProQ [Saliniradius amylolyticus]